MALFKVVGIMAALLTFSYLHADDAREIPAMFFAAGPSVPSQFQLKSNYNSEGPSRHSGGEHFVIESFTDKTGKAVKLTNLTSAYIIAYSTSTRGQILVRDVKVIDASDRKNPVTTPLTKLMVFTPGDKGSDHDGHLLLGDQQVVNLRLEQPVKFNRLEFTVEGFSDPDASFMITLFSRDADSQVRTFRRSRSGTGESEAGGGHSGGGSLNPDHGGHKECSCGMFEVCVHQILGWKCIDPANSDNKCSTDWDCKGFGVQCRTDHTCH